MKNLVKSRNIVSSDREITLNGLGVSKGIAIGCAHIHIKSKPYIPEYKISDFDIKVEIKRLEDAIITAKKQILALKEQVNKTPADALIEVSYLLDVHKAILHESRLIRGVKERISHERINAEFALKKEIQQIRKDFFDSKNLIFSNSCDEVIEVGKRLIRNLTDTPEDQIEAPHDTNKIIIGDQISPSEAAILNKKHIAGFATESGGPEGHTAILARSLGLPAILGVKNLLKNIDNGTKLILDGNLGHIIVNPSADIINKYKKLQKELIKAKKKLSWLYKVPSLTKDNVRITLQANIEVPKEISTAIKNGAEGIGLLRSEFCYVNNKQLPTENDHFEQIKNIVEAMKGRPVTVRTLDCGSDKIFSFNERKQHESHNPALGLRAIRLCLKNEELLKNQFSGILRCSVLGTIRILIPMITKTEEIIRVREIYNETIHKLKIKKIPISNPPPPLGIMIETPSAALISSSLAKHCDFMSIGTNDLTMYTLAIDRSDEQVAYLYNCLHPSVLKLIRMTVKNCHIAKIPVSICGEIAADPKYTAILIGLGIRDFSMRTSSIINVKNSIRYIDTHSANQLANNILSQDSEEQILKTIKAYNQNINIPELY